MAENTANFVIRVKNPTHINFEKTRQMRFKVVAKEVQQDGRANTADVTVHINDENDNAPVFERDKYTAEIPENSKAGTPVIQVNPSSWQPVDCIIPNKLRKMNLNLHEFRSKQQIPIRKRLVWCATRTFSANTPRLSS